jgi:hypothetical protein
VSAIAGLRRRRCASMWWDSSWRSRASWPCETGQGRLWHGLAPPGEGTMTTMSSAGRLEHARFFRCHGMVSTLIRKESIKNWVSRVLLYRQTMHIYLAFTAIGNRDLLV